MLVGLAFVSALAGTALQLAGRRWELSPSLELLARLLAYHGFVLLPILGAGGFLLPRFLGRGTRRETSGAGEPSRAWSRSAAVARGTGILILGTYLLEAFGWSRAAGTLRALLVIGYLAFEMPLERLRWNWCGVRWYLAAGLVSIPIGILAATWLPGMRLTMSHLELLGGFGLITTGIATRVVFGHSGAGEKLDRFHPVLAIAAFLMLFGMVGRIVSDYLPDIQTTHYIYAAVCWIAGLGVWAVAVLPRVLRTDPLD